MLWDMRGVGTGRCPLGLEQFPEDTEGRLRLRTEGYESPS